MGLITALALEAYCKTNDGVEITLLDKNQSDFDYPGVEYVPQDAPEHYKIFSNTAECFIVLGKINISIKRVKYKPPLQEGFTKAFILYIKLKKYSKNEYSISTFDFFFLFLSQN
jgi:hypothetical protein